MALTVGSWLAKSTEAPWDRAYMTSSLFTAQQNGYRARWTELRLGHGLKFVQHRWRWRSINKYITLKLHKIGPLAGAQSHSRGFYTSTLLAEQMFRLYTKKQSAREECAELCSKQQYRTMINTVAIRHWCACSISVYDAWWHRGTVMYETYFGRNKLDGVIRDLDTTINISTVFWWYKRYLQPVKCGMWYDGCKHGFQKPARHVMVIYRTMYAVWWYQLQDHDFTILVGKHEALLMDVAVFFYHWLYALVYNGDIFYCCFKTKRNS